MDAFRCPHLDVLGRQYIEAFRRVSEGELFYQTAGEKAFALHDLQELSETLVLHRTVCPLCRLTRGRSAEEIYSAMSALAPTGVQISG